MPAWDALMPEFAIRPSATATSSTEYPRDPASGATYLKDSPIIETVVLELELAAARTSAKWPASSADCPKAVRASVTMSETVARSSPDAAARDMMPEMPAVISSAFHPARAIYSNASPASVAENLVDAPISLALASRSAIWSAVDPDRASTFDIWLSKSAVVLIAAVNPATAAPEIGANAFPTPLILSPTPEILSPAALNCSPSTDALCLACFSSASSSFVVFATSAVRVAYCSDEISPLASASAASLAAVFSASNFFLVSSMASARSCCF